MVKKNTPDTGVEIVHLLTGTECKVVIAQHSADRAAARFSKFGNCGAMPFLEFELEVLPLHSTHEQLAHFKIGISIVRGIK